MGLETPKTKNQNWWFYAPDLVGKTRKNVWYCWTTKRVVLHTAHHADFFFLNGIFAGAPKKLDHVKTVRILRGLDNKKTLILIGLENDFVFSWTVLKHSSKTAFWTGKLKIYNIFLHIYNTTDF